MVLRIALVAVSIIILAGFTPPKLPRDSRGIYNFEPVNAGQGYKTQTGGAFSLTIGFKRNALTTSEEGHSHRERAQELIDKLSNRLSKLDIPGAEITVGKLYATTREIIVNVRVDDAGETDSVRQRITDFLSKTNGVLFVGEPGNAKVQ